MTSCAFLPIVLSRAPWGVWVPGEIQSGLSAVAAGGAVAFLVYRLVRRVPWPRRFLLAFFVNLAAAIATTLLWVGLSIGLIFVAIVLTFTWHWRTRRLAAVPAAALAPP